YRAAGDLAISDIRDDKKGNLWLGTGSGLWVLRAHTTAPQKFTGNDSIEKKLACTINRIIVGKNDELYLATFCGIKIIDPATSAYQEIKYDPTTKFSISSNGVYSIAIDRSGNLWAACAHAKSLLEKIDLQNKTVKHYERFTDPQKKWSNNTILNLLIDSKGRLWGTSSTSGLFVYDDKTDNFFDYRNDPLFTNSLAANPNGCLFQGSFGNIWLGTAGYGLIYFNPDNNLFYSILPVFKKDPGIWARTACEDRQGNLWLGTGSGIARYDRQRQSFTELTNEEEKKPVLYTNSVRSLLEDDNGDIWIGTAKGLNRYHPSTGGMDFFNEKQGMTPGFFWMMAKMRNDDIWFGSTYGLYHYIRKENRFDDLSKDSLLSKYAHRNVQALYADSKNRLWIGLLDVGLVLYEPSAKTARLLTIKDSLISDTRFSSFAEDKSGIMWIGSENGLTAYDVDKNCSRFFTGENGLPSNRTNNLMVDFLNRLWIGTSNGLCVMSRDRNRIRRFDINDGLPSNQFNEQAAFRTSDGFFVYATYNGFTIFRPEDYKENRSEVPLYITSFKISEKEFRTATNIEELKNVHLRYNENFFRIELAGLNYMNPRQCTYAYKLEPFDKDWVYTNKKEVNYTNVPAGNYTFHYKVITDNASWNVKDKILGISIAAIFYETWWFRSLIILAIGLGLVAFYRYRINHRERILILQSKAQILEKEKALVMYESLKQQLNPHFLFNSLTSLSSLIQQDQKIAKQFLDQMSKIYRYILKNRDSEFVPLMEDVNLAEVYTKLQQTRFQRGLQVSMNIGEENYHRKIVPVTLQNLIENAIKHNVIDNDSPLFVDIFMEDDYVVVRNNLHKKNFVETSNKQGLVNMRSLYHYLVGKEIVINEDEKYFTVKIPLL
ncbi:MAG TPA: two-component regulator propeller domain-containing protein, partial [Chitinophagaceae bacterium]|nr:two-component regulator propeller domain-containing protein [Chitinophagaceae bacterium]